MSTRPANTPSRGRPRARVSGALRKRANRRDSPEAIAKRVSARHFNSLFGGKAEGRDGRTELRRRRLLGELEQGKSRASKKALKPVDVLLRVNELLELGETVSSLRKVVRRARVFRTQETSAVIDAVGKLHAAYEFRLETYRLVGISSDLLRAAGVLL